MGPILKNEEKWMPNYVPIRDSHDGKENGAGPHTTPELKAQKPMNDRAETPMGTGEIEKPWAATGKAPRKKETNADLGCASAIEPNQSSSLRYSGSLMESDTPRHREKQTIMAANR